MAMKYIFNFCIRFACLVSLAALLPAGRLPGSFTAEALTYREVEGSVTVTHAIVITATPPGYSIEISSTRTGGNPVRQTFRTASDFSTLAWTFSDPGRQMELDARRMGEFIVLAGSYAGKKVEKKFPGAGATWNQLFQMGLGAFVGSGGESFQFRSIGTQGPGELKIGKFTVTRKGGESIDLAGKTVQAVRLRISLSGLLSIFWHGDYWFRRGDGRFLRSRGKNRPGGPPAVSELVEEKADGM
jgi:hypothetical protein